VVGGGLIYLSFDVGRVVTRSTDSPFLTNQPTNQPSTVTTHTPTHTTTPQHPNTPIYQDSGERFCEPLDYIFLSPHWQVLDAVSLPSKETVLKQPCPFPDEVGVLSLSLLLVLGRSLLGCVGGWKGGWGWGRFCFVCLGGLGLIARIFRVST
jgi:hypothetical protein